MRTLSSFPIDNSLYRLFHSSCYVEKNRQSHQKLHNKFKKEIIIDGKVAPGSSESGKYECGSKKGFQDLLEESGFLDSRGLPMRIFFGALTIIGVIAAGLLFTTFFALVTCLGLLGFIAYKFLQTNAGQRMLSNYMRRQYNRNITKVQNMHKRNQNMSGSINYPMNGERGGLLHGNMFQLFNLATETLISSGMIVNELKTNIKEDVLTLLQGKKFYSPEILAIKSRYGPSFQINKLQEQVSILKNQVYDGKQCVNNSGIMKLQIRFIILTSEGTNLEAHAIVEVFQSSESIEKKTNEEEKIDHDYEYLQLTIRTPGNDIIDLTNEANNLLISYETMDT